MGFIYKITNQVNNKIYVGQTTSSIKERWKEHISDSKRSINKDRPLYRAFNKYGINNFIIEQIEECSNSEINNREIYWIKYYDSYKKGYNATLGGEGRPFVDYDLILNLWNQGKNRTQISKETGHDMHTITRALKGKGITDKELDNRKLYSCNKPVAKLDKDTLQVLKIYSSISEAEREFNIQLGKSHISKVCQGKRQTTLGYKWKFI